MNNEYHRNITNEQANAVKYILKEYPKANMNTNDYTVVEIVLQMNDLALVDKAITLFKQGFEENEIVSIINKSDDKIQLIYKLMLDYNVKRSNATDMIFLSEKDLQIALKFINIYKINDSDLTLILNNQFDNMFSRMERLIQLGAPIMFAYEMGDENNDTDEIIMKVLNLVSNGMDIYSAYNESI